MKALRSRPETGNLLVKGIARRIAFSRSISPIPQRPRRLSMRRVTSRTGDRVTLHEDGSIQFADRTNMIKSAAKACPAPKSSAPFLPWKACAKRQWSRNPRPCLRRGRNRLRRSASRRARRPPGADPRALQAIAGQGQGPGRGHRHRLDPQRHTGQDFEGRVAPEALSGNRNIRFHRLGACRDDYQGPVSIITDFCNNSGVRRPEIPRA